MNRKILIIIAVQTLMIVVLFWLLVFYGKDEYAQSPGSDQEKIPTQNMTARDSDNTQGAATLVLSEKSQKLSGIETTLLKPTTYYPAATVLGSVVGLEELVDLRARYQATLAESNGLRSTLVNAQQELQRLQLLNRDDHNVSDRTVQTAEALVKSEQAKLAAADTQATGIRDHLRQQWGETLATWATRENVDDALLRLLQYRDVLIKVTLPFDARPDEKTHLLVAPLGAPEEQVGAQWVSLAPQIDVMGQGKTYFYRAPSASLRNGMRVIAKLQNKVAARQGVIVPHAAVLWFSNKAWVYQKIAADKFVRREISADIEVSEKGINGWFNPTAVKAGDEVVSSGAQLMLSEELKFQIRDENED